MMSIKRRKGFISHRRGVVSLCSALAKREDMTGGQ